MKYFKIFSICLVAVLLLIVLSGCGKNGEDWDVVGNSEDANHSVNDTSDMLPGTDEEFSLENLVCPWDEPGAKQPPEYTWEEYEALSDIQREAFFESFEDPASYDFWLRKSRGEELLPWEVEEKEPSEYTWEEYQQLSAEQQAAFQMSFESVVSFDMWLTNAQSNVMLPWDNGGKKPSEYTWEEYDVLDDFLKEAFFESFEDEQEMEKWITENMPNQ